jgi:hypothetical protein
MIDTDCNASINRLRSDLETFKNQTRRDVIAITDNNLNLTNQCAAIPTLYNLIDEARKAIAGLEVSKADSTISQDIKDNFSAIQQVNSQIESFINKIDACSNYIDKYLPV